MSDKSKIQWTDASWNVIIGCSHASPGCDNCYAEKMAYRLGCMGVPFYDMVQDEGGWNGTTEFVESALGKPLHWRKSRNIFVCSMADLFHESVPFEWIDKVFAVMWECYCRTSGHTFQLLTKRPERMADYYNSKPWTRVHVIIKEMFGRNWGAGRLVWPSNVWLGVTAENQEQADKRIPILLQIPAALRFVSVEPMLGPVDLWQWLGGDRDIKNPHKYDGGLSWVIIGAESGTKRRWLDTTIVKPLVNQCKEAGVPVFVKQLHSVHANNPTLIKSPEGWPREMPKGVAK